MDKPEKDSSNNNEVEQDKIPVIYLKDSVEPKKRNRSHHSGFGLTIATTIICSIVAVLVLLPMLFGFLMNNMLISYCTVIIMIGLETIKYIPLIILIILSAATSLIFFIESTDEKSKLDDSAQTKITKRSLLSAILLLAPAVTFPIINLVRLYDSVSNFHINYLVGGLTVTLVINLTIIIVLHVLKKKKGTIKDRKIPRTLVITLFISELILCGSGVIAAVLQYIGINA